ncbi:MAG TPA: RtcB family protein [Actinomycetota bacterium]|nr:RtcB family protein [Actinomycetota bacterium]
MELQRIDEFTWEVPIGWAEGMRVPGRIFASESLAAKAVEDRGVDQVAAVATLPGIVDASLAMPDIHWGYGFPIGGVAATDPNRGGVVSPGGVGFDIGCGVRLVSSGLSWAEVRPKIRDLVRALGQNVPRGTGGRGAMTLAPHEMDDVLERGVEFALSKGIGSDEDAELCEDAGTLPGADAGAISARAKERGADQLGSLGAGNHFLEVQVVDAVLDANAAVVLGLELDQVCVMIHSGSRGIGHQTCTDHVRTIDRLMPTLGIEVPDRQLACAPVEHPAAQRYLAAMNAAGNYARANRHLLMDAARDTFKQIFRVERASLKLIYDISHNLAKIEDHEVDGHTTPLCVHRKGATRAFGPGHPEIPERYRAIGQPVIVPGSMGTHSFLLTGSGDRANRSFASTCHGAGRAMSRTQAKKQMDGRTLKRDLEAEGILIAASNAKLLSEEAPYAYKDVSEVVETCEGAGLSQIVARLRPVGVVKG